MTRECLKLYFCKKKWKHSLFFLTRTSYLLLFHFHHKIHISWERTTSLSSSQHFDDHKGTCEWDSIQECSQEWIWKNLIFYTYSYKKMGNMVFILYSFLKQSRGNYGGVKNETGENEKAWPILNGLSYSCEDGLIF